MTNTVKVIGIDLVEWVSRDRCRSQWKAGFAKEARTIATGGVGGAVADLPGGDGIVSGHPALGMSIHSPRACANRL